MALGLAGVGHGVLAVGHLPEDIAELTKDAAARGVANNVKPLIADIRKPDACDRVIETALDHRAFDRDRSDSDQRQVALEAFGSVDILVNNAGLTFTYIWPGRFRRTEPMRFWETSDEITRNVMDTNYVAATQMARRVAPICVAQGWGRIVNVTTKLSTMNQIGAMPYGASKAALEMATEVWASEAAGTGLTINIVNPGAGANTLSMDEEMRAWSAQGTKPKLVEPEQMVPPLLWVVSEAANAITGWRYDAIRWDASLPPAESHRRHGSKAGMVLHPGAH